jgi:hypothetical protein
MVHWVKYRKRCPVAYVFEENVVTYPRHMKIVFRGIFLNTPEEWSFSTKWDIEHTGDPDGDIGNIDATGIRNALTGMLSTASFHSSTQCTGWRAYEIGSDGRMQGNPRIEEFATADYVKGQASTGALPPQVSLCVTTEAENRGPARYGRFYLPGLNVTLGSDLRLSVAQQTDYLNKVVTFTKAVADSIDVPLSPVSTSMVNVSGVGTGTLQTVRNLKVGRVLDTVRRRRGAMDEGYLASGTIDW